MKNGCKWANTAGDWRKGWISVERAFWSHTSETSRTPERGQTAAMAERKCACPSGDGWRGASWRHRGFIYSPSQGVLAALWKSLLEEPQEAMKCGPADVSGLVRSPLQGLRPQTLAVQHFPVDATETGCITELNRVRTRCFHTITLFSWPVHVETVPYTCWRQANRETGYNMICQSSWILIDCFDRPRNTNQNEAMTFSSSGLLVYICEIDGRNIVGGRLWRIIPHLTHQGGILTGTQNIKVKFVGKKISGY